MTDCVHYFQFAASAVHLAAGPAVPGVQPLLDPAPGQHARGVREVTPHRGLH